MSDRPTESTAVLCACSRRDIERSGERKVRIYFYDIRAWYSSSPFCCRVAELSLYAVGRLVGIFAFSVVISTPIESCASTALCAGACVWVMVARERHEVTVTLRWVSGKEWKRSAENVYNCASGYIWRWVNG